MRRLALAFAAVLAACGSGPQNVGPPLTASPSHGSMFGQYQVKLSGNVSALGQVTDVKFGGIEAYDLQATATTLTVTLQGAPKPGPVDVEVTGSRGNALDHGLFTYDPAARGVPLEWMAFGASLTQGTQSGGIDPHSQIWGYSGQLAKAAGVFLALPLFQPAFVPQVQPTQLTPDCVGPTLGSMIPSMAQSIIGPDGNIDLALARIDPTMTPRDIAIGGEPVKMILNGGTGNLALLEHVVEDPMTSGPNNFMAPVKTSQIDRLEAQDPDVAFSADLLANDLDPAATQTDDVHPEEITPLDQVQPLLVEMMQRLGKLHGQYFIANMPSLTFLPDVKIAHDHSIAAGTETEASFEAKKEQIDQETDAYDQALADAMKPYRNLHLVDFKAAAEKLERDGVEVNGEHLTVAAYGGLLSLDDVHFTDTGYAILANVFIDAMNPVLHARIPDIDLAQVEKNDALSPAHLRADGLECVPPP